MLKSRSPEQGCGLLLLGTVAVGGAFVLIGYFLAYQVMDTSARREFVAISIRELAAQHERNPKDPRNLNAIISHAKGDYEFGRTYAIWALGELRTPAKPALPILVQSLRSSDQTTVKAAAIALGKYGPTAIDATPELIRVMDEWKGTDASWFAADALGRIGSADPHVIAALKAAATDEDPRLREMATRALESLQTNED